MTNKIPEFKGTLLIEIPAFIPSVNFLEGDFGKAVLEEYRGRAKKDYGNASALNVLSYDHGIVKGSNPFAVALVNQIISEEGLRTATQADLERIIKVNALPLRGQYEDSGLVLRTKDNPNEYFAKNLMVQIKARNPKAKMPAMISLFELKLVLDMNSPYNLGFKIKDSAQIFYDLSVLNKEGNFSSEDTDEKIGLPKKTGSEGNRPLYIRGSGLSELCLSRDLRFFSFYGDLAGSDGDGRVVVVSAKSTAKILELYMSQLQEERASREAKLTSRFDTAKKIIDKAYKQAEDSLRTSN